MKLRVGRSWSVFVDKHQCVKHDVQLKETTGEKSGMPVLHSCKMHSGSVAVVWCQEGRTYQEIVAVVQSQDDKGLKKHQSGLWRERARSFWYIGDIESSIWALVSGDELPFMTRYLPDMLRSVQKHEHLREERKVELSVISVAVEWKIMWVFYFTEQDLPLSLVGHQQRVCMEWMWIPSLLSNMSITPGKKHISVLLCQQKSIQS